MSSERFTLVVVVELGEGTLSGFDAYERRVLELLGRHGGRLERRMRAADERTEVHVLSFGSAAGFQAYLEDPERAALRPLLDGLDVRQRVLEVTDEH